MPFSIPDDATPSDPNGEDAVPAENVGIVHIPGSETRIRTISSFELTDKQSDNDNNSSSSSSNHHHNDNGHAVNRGGDHNDIASHHDEETEFLTMDAGVDENDSNNEPHATDANMAPFSQSIGATVVATIENDGTQKNNDNDNPTSQQSFQHEKVVSQTDHSSFPSFTKVQIPQIHPNSQTAPAPNQESPNDSISYPDQQAEDTPPLLLPVVEMQIHTFSSLSLTKERITQIRDQNSTFSTNHSNAHSSASPNRAPLSLPLVAAAKERIAQIRRRQQQEDVSTFSVQGDCHNSSSSTFLPSITAGSAVETQPNNSRTSLETINGGKERVRRIRNATSSTAVLSSTATRVAASHVHESSLSSLVTSREAAIQQAFTEPVAFSSVSLEIENDDDSRDQPYRAPNSNSNDDLDDSFQERGALGILLTAQLVNDDELRQEAVRIAEHNVRTTLLANTVTAEQVIAIPDHEEEISQQQQQQNQSTALSLSSLAESASKLLEQRRRRLSLSLVLICLVLLAAVVTVVFTTTRVQQNPRTETLLPDAQTRGAPSNNYNCQEAIQVPFGTVHMSFPIDEDHKNHSVIMDAVNVTSCLTPGDVNPQLVPRWGRWYTYKGTGNDVTIRLCVVVSNYLASILQNVSAQMNEEVLQQQQSGDDPNSTPLLQFFPAKLEVYLGERCTGLTCWASDESYASEFSTLYNPALATITTVTNDHGDYDNDSRQWLCQSVNVADNSLQEGTTYHVLVQPNTEALSLSLPTNSSDNNNTSMHQDPFLDDFSLLITAGKDNCPDASRLYTYAWNSFESTVLATSDLVPSCNYDMAMPTNLTTIAVSGIWYYFRKSSNDAGFAVSVRTCNSSFDARVSVFVGGCDNLTCLAHDHLKYHDEICGPQHFVIWIPQKDEIYHILFHGRESSDVGALAVVAVSFDKDFLCMGANVLDFAYYVGAYGAINEGGDISADYQDMITQVTCGPDAFSAKSGRWLTFQGFNSSVSLIACNTDDTVRISIYSGSCDGLVCADVQYTLGAVNMSGAIDYCSAQSRLATFFAISNVTYYAFIHGSSAQQQSLNYNMFVEIDFCTTQQGPFVPNGTWYTSSLDGASEQDVSACGTTAVGKGPGKIFRFYGTGGIMTASTCYNATEFDTVISVMTGGCVPALWQCVGTNDNADSTSMMIGTANDDCDSNRSLVSWDSVAEQLYYVVVQATTHTQSSTNQGLGFGLSVFTPYADTCQGAVDQTGPKNSSGITFYGTTVDATVDSDVPDCGALLTNETSGPGVWFAVQGTGGNFSISDCEKEINITITIFSGSCSNLICVDRIYNYDCTISTLADSVGNNTNDDGIDSSNNAGTTTSLPPPSSLTWKTQRSQPYYLLVNGVTENDLGSFRFGIVSFTAS